LDKTELGKTKTFCPKSGDICPATLPPVVTEVRNQGFVFVTGNPNIKDGAKTQIGYFNLGVPLGGDKDVLSIPLDPFEADNGLIYSSTLVGKGLMGGTPAFQVKVTNRYGKTYEIPFIKITTAAPTMAPMPPSECVNDPIFSKGGKKRKKKENDKKMILDVEFPPEKANDCER